MRILLILFSLISGCVQASSNNTLVLDYKDFGPPSAAYELIGNDWWQWLPHGDPRPKSYKIKVVVFRGIDLKKAKQLFPVNEHKKQDYRYVKYTDAMNYLNQNIKQDLLPDVTKIFKSTKKKLKDHFEK